MKFKKLWIVSVLAVAVLFGVLCLVATKEVNAAETQYKITFRGNGGKTSQNQDRYTQQFTPGKPITLAPNYFNRSGYKFVGWGLLSSSTNPTYQPNQPISSAPWKMNIELHAIWSVDKAQYKIVYTNTDGKTYTQIAYIGEKVTLQSSVFSRSGYTLLGWSTKKGKFVKESSDYSLGAKVNALASKKDAVVGLYPIWKAQYKVVYNGNGGWYDQYGTGDRSKVSYSVVETTGVKLTANKFQYNDNKSLYTLVGWGNDPKNPTKILDPGFKGDVAAEFGITSPSKSKEINVYAIWVQEGTPYKIASKPLSKGEPTLWSSNNGKTMVMYLTADLAKEFAAKVKAKNAETSKPLIEKVATKMRDIIRSTAARTLIKESLVQAGYTTLGAASVPVLTLALYVSKEYENCDKLMPKIVKALENANAINGRAIKVTLYYEKSLLAVVSSMVAKPFVTVEPYSGVLRTGASWDAGYWITPDESGLTKFIETMK